MKFHVWDFPDRIEVRFNAAFINRIRNMTVEKKVHVKEKRGRRREFFVTKRLKLIAFRVGHPHHDIAKRLYRKVDYRYGRYGTRTDHRPFVSVEQFLRVHEITGLPLEEMEQNVIEVRNRWSGRQWEFPMKFPVIANEDWAWLLGLWYGCGGLITRTRKKTAVERTVRFKIEKEVFEKKVKPILKRIAYVPDLSDVWYVRKGLKHRLDKDRRKGIGNQPRKFFTLVRPIREIMEKFGLPREHVSQKHKIGSKYGARKFHMNVPTWIKETKRYAHAFIEGYINGGSIGSDFRRAPKGHLRRTMEIRFSGFSQEEVGKFYNFFEEYFGELGITGYPHYPQGKMYSKTSKLYWRGFLIHNDSSLRSVYEKFDIARPDLRARLRLNYFMDTFLYEVCRELDSLSILILGLILEKPRTFEEIVNLLRLSDGRTEKVLQKLLKNRILQTDGYRFFVEIAVFNPSISSSFLVTRLQLTEKEVMM